MDNHHKGQGGLREGVQEGPHHVAEEGHKIVKIGWKSTRLGKLLAWVKDYQVPTWTTITKAKVDSGRGYNKDLIM